MNAMSFMLTCKSLVKAESATINHLTELMFNPNPSWEDIEKGYRLANELNQTHTEALEGFAQHVGSLQSDEVTLLLKRSATTLAETLLVLDDLATRYHSRS